MFVSLEEVKEGLNKTTDKDNAELAGVTEAVCNRVAEFKQEVIEPRTVTETRVVAPILLLRQRPVLELLSVQSADSNRTWNVTDFDVDPVTGEITARAGVGLAGRVRFTYQAGYLDPPQQYVEAVKVIVAHIWSLQRTSTMGRNQYGSQQDDDVAFNPGLGYAFPNRALELLGAKLPGIA